MVHITVKQNNFSAGEISDRYLGRDDLNLYNSGALLLQNIDILPSGAVQKRRGLKSLSVLSDGNVRLHKFAATSDKFYLLVFSPGKLQIFDTATDTLIATLQNIRPEVAGVALPWQAEHLDGLDFTQCPGFLLICHGALRPMVLTSNTNTAEDRQFHVEEWPGRENNGGKLYHYPFSREFITEPSQNDISLELAYDGRRNYLAATSGSGSSVDHFDNNWRGKTVKVGGSLVECQESKSGASQRFCQVVSGGLQSPTTDYGWALWSDTDGWPRAACLHRGRVIFAGNKDKPANLYMSKIGDYFSIATVFMSAEDQELDDSPIEITLQRDDTTTIRHVISTRHLHVFTDTEEWVFDDDVITPTNIGVTPRTGIGFHPSAKLAPFSVNNTIIACDSHKGELYEYFHAEIDDSYTANNLNHLTADFENAPTAIDYDLENRRIYCVMPDGEIRVLALYGQEKITAWSRYQTLGGEFKDVTCINEHVYTVVARRLERHALTAEGESRQIFFLEKFSNDMTVDSFMPLRRASSSLNNRRVPTLLIDALFAGRQIRIFADGQPIITSERDTHDLFAGQILEHATGDRAVFLERAKPVWGEYHAINASLAIGLPIETRLEAFPPVVSAPTQHHRYRLLEALLYVKDVENFRVNIASRNIVFGNAGADSDNTGGVVVVSREGHKKIKIKSLGWHDSQGRPPWVFIHDEAEPMILLGAEMRLSVN